MSTSDKGKLFKPFIKGHYWSPAPEGVEDSWMTIIIATMQNVFITSFPKLENII